MNYKNISIAEKLKRGIQVSANRKRQQIVPARTRSKDCKNRNISLNDASTRRVGESLDKTRSPKNIELQQVYNKKRDCKPVAFQSFFKFWGSPKNIRARQPPTPLRRNQGNNFFSNQKYKGRNASKDRVVSEQKNQNIIKKDKFNQTIRSKQVQAMHRKKAVPPIPSHKRQEQENMLKHMDAQSELGQNVYGLADQDFKKFGNRFPTSFLKKKLLGQGGFACVWLGEHKKSGKPFAVKQILTNNEHQTHKKQIWFGTYFFKFKGVAKKQFQGQEGINHIARLYSYQMNYVDTWLIYQKCGQSLGKCLYQLEEEEVMGMQMFRLVPKPLYKKMRGDLGILKRIVVGIAKALKLIADNKIVHSDLKSENVLIRMKAGDVAEVKVIDYGSCFLFEEDELDEFSMATPEYMSPELLSFIQKENGKPFAQEMLQRVREYKQPWVIDIWSLGCIILQILHGVPVWLNCHTIVQRPGDNRLVTTRGAFAVDGRKFDVIIKKQLSVVQNLDQFLSKSCLSGIQPDGALREVLKGCLQLHPRKRISPAKIIELLG